MGQWGDHMADLSALITQAKTARRRYNRAKNTYHNLRRAGKKQRDCGLETEELGKAAIAYDQTLISLALAVIGDDDEEVHS